MRRHEASKSAPTFDPMEELDAEDLRAIEESEQQIARGQCLDWQDVSARLRAKYLGESNAHSGSNASRS